MHICDCRTKAQGKPPVHLNPPDWSWQAMLATAKSLGGKVAREANPESKKALKQQLAQLKADMEQAKNFKNEPQHKGYATWKGHVQATWNVNSQLMEACKCIVCMHANALSGCMQMQCYAMVAVKLHRSTASSLMVALMLFGPDEAITKKVNTDIGFLGVELDALKAMHVHTSLHHELLLLALELSRGSS